MTEIENLRREVASLRDEVVRLRALVNSVPMSPPQRIGDWWRPPMSPGSPLETPAPWAPPYRITCGGAGA